MAKSVGLPQAPHDIDDALAIVCTIPDAGRRERRLSAGSVIEAATEVREIEHGVALVFDGSADTTTMVVEFALAERECCAQFTFWPFGVVEAIWSIVALRRWTSRAARERA